SRRMPVPQRNRVREAALQRPSQLLQCGCAHGTESIPKKYRRQPPDPAPVVCSGPFRHGGTGLACCVGQGVVGSGRNRQLVPGPEGCDHSARAGACATKHNGVTGIQWGTAGRGYELASQRKSGSMRPEDTGGETDARLVRRAREGDRSAFETLVRRYLKSAYAVALAELGDSRDAEDAVQDSFIT